MNDSRTLYWTTMCEFVPRHIDWLADARTGNSDQLMWLNHSIISYSAAMIEGGFESVLRTRLYSECGVGIGESLPETCFNERVVVDLDKKIRAATGWDALKKLFKVIIGKTLAETVNDEAAIKSVANLFKLRNAVTAHGRAINFVRDLETFDISWESKNLNEVQTYLSSLGLWDGQAEEEFPSPSDFFSDSIADHFYEQSLKFLVLLDAPPTTIHSVPTGRTKEIIAGYRSQARRLG